MSGRIAFGCHTTMSRRKNMTSECLEASSVSEYHHHYSVNNENTCSLCCYDDNDTHSVACYSSDSDDDDDDDDDYHNSNHSCYSSDSDDDDDDDYYNSNQSCYYNSNRSVESRVIGKLPNYFKKRKNPPKKGEDVTTSIFKTPVTLKVPPKPFEFDYIALFNEYKSPKNKEKRDCYHASFDRMEKIRIGEKWIEKMHALQKHILFFDFIENYYTSKSVVSTKKPVTPVDSFKKPVSSTIELVDKMLAELQKEKMPAANTPVSKPLVSTKKPVVSAKKPVTSVDSFQKPVSSTIELVDKMLAELQKEKKRAANTPVSKPLVATKKPVVSAKKPVSSTIELVDKMLAELQKEKMPAANTPVSKPLVSTKKPVVIKEK
ncbi:uncharacterized protein LOC126727561 isoform X3 [Quercus robur]|uniref:uncharacterized protein LOC126727561 isoform X3 n=1 Tax=Quercus robur TaxID=38942 RepID=UPI00216383C1|nr:uncharacterized protein LOC126727561 isoform X3 [Quercus robur]